MRELTTEITIAAPPERVWAVLTEFETYPDWNPFITRVEGEAVIGSRLDADLKPEGRKATRIRPTVVEVEEGRLLAWLGHLGVKGIFDGRHRFEVTPGPDGGTRFVQSERFSGILSRPIMAMIEKATEAGFRMMNEALRDRSEAR